MDKKEIKPSIQEVRPYLMPVVKQIKTLSVVSSVKVYSNQLNAFSELNKRQEQIQSYFKCMNERMEQFKSITAGVKPLLLESQNTHKRLQEYIKSKVYLSEDDITSNVNQLTEFKKECQEQDKMAELYECALNKIKQLEKENREHSEEKERLKAELEKEHSARIEAEKSLQTYKKRSRNTKKLIDKTPELTNLMRTIKNNSGMGIDEIAKELIKSPKTIKIQLKEICEKVFNIEDGPKGIKTVRNLLKDFKI